MTHHQGYLYLTDPVTGQTTEVVNHARTLQALQFAHLPQVRSLYEEGLCEAYYWAPDCATESLDPVSFGLPDASQWASRRAAAVSFPGVDGNIDVASAPTSDVEVAGSPLLSGTSGPLNDETHHLDLPALTAGNLYLLSVGVGEDMSSSDWTASHPFVNFELVEHHGAASPGPAIFRCQPSVDVSAATLTISGSNFVRFTVDELTDTFDDSEHNGALAIVQSATNSGTSSSLDVAFPGRATPHNGLYTIIELDSGTGVGVTGDGDEIVSFGSGTTFTSRIATDGSDSLSWSTGDGGSYDWGVTTVEVNRRNSINGTNGLLVKIRKHGDFSITGDTQSFVAQDPPVWLINASAAGALGVSWLDQTAGSFRNLSIGNVDQWDGWPWFMVWLQPDDGSGEASLTAWRSMDGVDWEQVAVDTEAPAADIAWNDDDLVVAGTSGGSGGRAAEVDLVDVQVSLGSPDVSAPVASRDYTVDSTEYADPYGNEWQLQNSEWSWLYNPVEAPWYDPNIPQSAHALGFLIDEWTGLGSDHVRSSSTELGAIGRGASLGPRTPGPRTQSINLTLFGENEEGLDYLFRWLEATLNSMHDPSASVDLLTRLTCPEDVDSWDGIVKQRKVACVEGLHWIDQPLPRSGCVVRRANFVMAAEDPCMYVDRPELDVSTVATSWTRDDLDELSFEACDPTLSGVFRAGLDSSIVELDVPFDRPAVGAAGVDVEIAFDSNWFDNGFIYTAPLRVQVFALRGDTAAFYESMPLLGQVTFRGILELEHVSRLELRYDTVRRQIFERSSSFVGWQPGWRWVAPARGQPGPWWGSVTCHGFKVVVYPTDVCTDWPLVPEFTVRARVGERISCP